jgi:hypothetical protein
MTLRDPSLLLSFFFEGVARRPRQLLRALFTLDPSAAESWLAVEAALSLQSERPHAATKAPGAGPRPRSRDDRARGKGTLKVDARPGRLLLGNAHPGEVSVELAVIRQPASSTAGASWLRQPLEQLQARLDLPRRFDEPFGALRAGLAVVAGTFPRDGKSSSPPPAAGSVVDDLLATAGRIFTAPLYRLPLHPGVQRLLLGQRLHHPESDSLAVELAVVWIDRTLPPADPVEEKQLWEAALELGEEAPPTEHTPIQRTLFEPEDD